MNCKICDIEKNLDNEDLIFESNFWTVILSWSQRYIGRCLIFPKRHFGHMSEMTTEENTDFFIVVQKIEEVIRKTFGADMFNWSCLGNNFYKKENPDPHLHWHMRPRYRNKIVLDGQIFEDKEFGHHYNKNDDGVVATRDIRAAVLEKIRKNL